MRCVRCTSCRTTLCAAHPLHCEIFGCQHAGQVAIIVQRRTKKMPFQGLVGLVELGSNSRSTLKPYGPYSLYDGSLVV